MTISVSKSEPEGASIREIARTGRIAMVRGSSRQLEMKGTVSGAHRKSREN